MINKNTYVLIMAGGVGSRFWPKSRQHFPKQFIDILGIGKSLLQLTYERFLNCCLPENIYVLSNAQYQGLISEQLPLLQPNQILLEPSRNNTAPCIAYASHKIAQLNADANIVVAPSDHLILKEGVFIEKIALALDYTATHDALLTLGISPTRPDTGYGYIKYEKQQTAQANEVYKVAAFMEKPALPLAQAFVASGDYLWNAGIFIWSAKSILRAFEKHAPALHQLFQNGAAAYNTDQEAGFIAEHYPKSDNISIDYAILENAANVYTIPADIGWSDLGTWASLHAVAEQDEAGNVGSEHIRFDGTSNCMVHLPKGKVGIIKGLHDYMVVDDGEVLLIYPKADEQEIKQVSAQVVATHGERYL